MAINAANDNVEWYEDDEFVPPADEDDYDDGGGVQIVGPYGPERLAV